MQRREERHLDQIRNLKATFNVFEYASGSVLLELGKTKILCAVTIDPGVPPFLKGTDTGWLTAEYSLMAASTTKRFKRDANKVNGRAIEISRLIGRSIRSVCDLSNFGEKTIHIYCDVMQADGGTRTASIIAACLALKKAQEELLKQHQINSTILKQDLAAISSGISKSEYILDLNYEEDAAALIDLNFVLTRDKKLVELQGTAEGEPISWQDFDKLRDLALKGAEQIFAFYDTL